MATLEDLMNAVGEAKKRLGKAEASRDTFLDPILVALGAKGGGISRCSTWGEELHVTRSGSCRGYRWDEDYTFPLAIFTSEDPLIAAVAYNSKQKQAKDKAERAEKLATVKRLSEELRHGKEDSNG